MLDRRGQAEGLDHGGEGLQCVIVILITERVSDAPVDRSPGRARGLDRLSALVSELDRSTPPVRGLGDEFDDSEANQLPDSLRNRLLGDAEVCSDLGCRGRCYEQPLDQVPVAVTKARAFEGLQHDATHDVAEQHHS